MKCHIHGQGELECLIKVKDLDMGKSTLGDPGRADPVTFMLKKQETVPGGQRATRPGKNGQRGDGGSCEDREGAKAQEDGQPLGHGKAM